MLTPEELKAELVEAARNYLQIGCGPDPRKAALDMFDVYERAQSGGDLAALLLEENFVLDEEEALGVAASMDSPGACVDQFFYWLEHAESNGNLRRRPRLVAVGPA